MRQLEDRTTGTAHHDLLALGRYEALLGVDGAAGTLRWGAWGAGAWGGGAGQRTRGAFVPGQRAGGIADRSSATEGVLGGTLAAVEHTERERERVRDRITATQRRKAHRRARRLGHRIR